MTSDICNPFPETIWNQELILYKKFPQKLKLGLDKLTLDNNYDLLVTKLYAYGFGENT